jgi:uncharacterized membrane protein YdbT with pleckstrin-like domain
MIETSKSIRNYMSWIIFGVITAPLGIGVVILAVVLLKYLYELAVTKYIFTENSIILKRGILSKSQKEVRYCDIRSLVLKQSFGQRIFKVGNIAVDCAAGDGVEILICGIGNPQNIIDFINANR